MSLPSIRRPNFSPAGMISPRRRCGVMPRPMSICLACVVESYSNMLAPAYSLEFKWLENRLVSKASVIPLFNLRLRRDHKTLSSSECRALRSDGDISSNDS